MPKYSYKLTNGKTLTLEGDEQPDDVEVEQIAAQAGVRLQASPEQLRAANDAPLKEPTTFAGGLVQGLRRSTNPVVGPWMRGGPDTIVAGVDKLKHGRMLGGAADLVKGGMTTVAPAALPFALVGAPLATVAGLAGGAVGDIGATKAAELAGAGEDVQNAAGVVGGLVGGGVGAAAARPVAAWAGPALIARGERLARVPSLTRHAQAGTGALIGGPKLGAAIELVQSPGANRLAGELLSKAGGVPVPPVTTRPGRLVKPAKVPPSLNEQLGVSPEATGANMDSLPEVAVPASSRTPQPLAMDSARLAADAEAARAAAGELGVAGASQSDQMPLGVGDESASLAASSRERIPVPPPQQPARLTTAKSFNDLAREMGLDPRKLQGDTLDPHMQQVLPDEAATVSGPQGVPAEAQSPSSVRAILDAAGAEGLSLTPPSTLDAAGRALWMREELAKQLMAQFAQNNEGVIARGTRKRGEGFSPE